MDRKDQVSGLIWLVMGLSITFASLFSLDVGTVYSPGPGLFPLISGILLSFLSLAILLKAAFAKTPADKRALRKLWAGLNWLKVFYILGALTIYVIILDITGFLLTTIALMAFFLKGIGSQKWKVTIGFSIFTSVCSYLLFDRILKVPFPRGFLGF